MAERVLQASLPPPDKRSLRQSCALLGLRPLNKMGFLYQTQLWKQPAKWLEHPIRWTDSHMSFLQAHHSLGTAVLVRSQPISAPMLHPLARVPSTPTSVQKAAVARCPCFPSPSSRNAQPGNGAAFLTPSEITGEPWRLFYYKTVVFNYLLNK